MLADQRKKAAKKQRRATRIADRARRFEQHAALVNERDGDPRFVRRITNPDGSATVIAPDEDGELAAAIAFQQKAFREKFGRDMGPDDPVFFDPDADEPTPTDAAAMSEEIRRTAGQMPDGEMRAYLLAWADVGYMVTEANQHTFSAHEVEAYFDAVEKYL